MIRSLGVSGIAVALALLFGGTVAPTHPAAQGHDQMAMPAARSGARSGLPHDIPDFAAKPTNRAVRSGSWSDATIWSTGQLPTAGEIVRIPAGVSVVYDATGSEALRALGIDGSLTFRTDVSTKLVAGTIEVLPLGSLEIGRVESPIAANVTAEIIIADAPLDPASDPDQFGTGLIGLGVVRMHGARVEPTFSRVAAEPKAGDRSVRLQTTPVAGWQQARLILPGTNQPTPNNGHNHPEWEELTSASTSGARIDLKAPLAFDHRGARDADSKLSFLPHVGNLSRNVIVRSANPLGTRGHVMFVYRAAVDIRYVLFKDLGRTTLQDLNPKTNHIGRYSMHMHHLFGPQAPPSNGYQFTLVGNAIDGGSKWGITVHDSHYGLVQGNVIYNVAGVGIMTEDGSETGNVIDGNFIVRSWGTGSDRGDDGMGTEGSGLWFRGPANTVRNNVVANTNSFAVSYLMLRVREVRVPSKPGADPEKSGKTVNMMAVPLREFANNEVYGVQSGLTLWNVGADCCTQVFEVPESTVKDFHLWHVGSKGYYGYATNRVTFDGWVQRGDSDVLAQTGEPVKGFYFSDYIARNTIIRNSDLQGLRVGIMLPAKVGDKRDIYGSQPGTVLIENSILRNAINIEATTMWGVTGGGAWLPPRQTIIRDVIFGPPAGPGARGTENTSGRPCLHSATPTTGHNQPPMDCSYSATRPEYDILMTFASGGSNVNFLVKDEVVVYNYNRIPGESFRVFYREQAPSFVVPPTHPGSVGPPAGSTNAENWSRSQMAIAGSVASCTAERPGIGGLACSTKSDK